MKKIATILVLVPVLFTSFPLPAFAGGATNAALGLGAFAVFNQIVGGVGIFGPRVVYVPVPPAPPSPAYYPPTPVYAPPAYYPPASVAAPTPPPPPSPSAPPMVAVPAPAAAASGAVVVPPTSCEGMVGGTPRDPWSQGWYDRCRMDRGFAEDRGFVAGRDGLPAFICAEETLVPNFQSACYAGWMKGRRQYEAAWRQSEYNRGAHGW